MLTATPYFDRYQTWSHANRKGTQYSAAINKICLYRRSPDCPAAATPSVFVSHHTSNHVTVCDARPLLSCENCQIHKAESGTEHILFYWLLSYTTPDNMNP